MNFDYVAIKSGKFQIQVKQEKYIELKSFSPDENGNLFIIVKRDGTILANPKEPIVGLSINNLSKNSVIVIYEGVGGFERSTLVLRGSNHNVVIKESQYKIKKLSIELKGKSLHCFIDKDFSCSGANINVREDTGIFIGRDCMFSNGINILNSDMHAIFDSTGKCINQGKDVVIGDHCWIGQNVQILKGVFLADGTIVGAQSVVTKSNLSSNSIIVGNPGKIIKTDVSWSRLAPLNFL